MAGATDNELVRRCLSGDTRAFGDLIDRYQRPVYNHALKTLGDSRDAEDVTQTVFMKAFENLGKFDPQFKFFSWVYRIAINESINHAKRRKVFDPLDERSVTTTSNVTDGDSEEEVLNGLMKLSAEDRAIVLLKHFEGFSYVDIEFIMDIPLKTVKSRLYSARQKLKEILIRERRVLDG